MRSARQSFFAAVFTLLALAAPVRADEESKSYDARLDGHTDGVQLQGGSTALTWATLAGLGILCVGVMFKNAKRTHLD